jgi:predicted ArsR family transcriptional regulator
MAGHDQILAWLAEHPQRSAGEIARALGVSDVSDVRIRLATLLERGKVQRTRNGHGAWEWEAAPDA